MHRIDGTTADTTTVPGKSLFTEGNPSLGVPATVVSDDWLNDVQENIMRVITNAATGSTKGSDADLYNAIAALIGAGSAAQGNYSSAEILVANKTLNSADKGKYFHLNANNLTITLPSPSTVPLGTRFAISQVANTGGILTAPANTLFNCGTNVLGTSINLTNKADFEIVAVSSSLWHVMPRNGAASIGANGYQYFPSGLVMQWGTVANGASRTITWNNAFNNAVVSVVAMSRTDDDTVQVTSANSSGATFTTNASITGASTTNGFYWIALGY